MKVCMTCIVAYNICVKCICSESDNKILNSESYAHISYLTYIYYDIYYDSTQQVLLTGMPNGKKL